MENITYPYQKGYDYFGQLPVYRVNFANWKGTRIYVSPYTGDIRLRRNIDRRYSMCSGRCTCSATSATISPVTRP